MFPEQELERLPAHLSGRQAEVLPIQYSRPRNSLLATQQAKWIGKASISHLRSHNDKGV